MGERGSTILCAYVLRFLRSYTTAKVTKQGYHPQIHAILTLEAIQNQGKYYREIQASKLAYRTLSEILDRGV